MVDIHKCGHVYMYTYTSYFHAQVHEQDSLTWYMDQVAAEQSSIYKANEFWPQN